MITYLRHSSVLIIFMFKNFNNVCKYNCVVVDNNVAIVVTSHLICSWICTVCSSTLTRTEKGFAPHVEHVGVPHVVMAEKGQIFVTLHVFLTGAGAMAPVAPWLTQNMAQWCRDRNTVC